MVVPRMPPRRRRSYFCGMGLGPTIVSCFCCMWVVDLFIMWYFLPSSIVEKLTNVHHPGDKRPFTIVNNPILLFGGSGESGSQLIAPLLREMGVNILDYETGTSDFGDGSMTNRLGLEYGEEKNEWSHMVEAILNVTGSANYEWKDLPPNLQDRITKGAAPFFQSIQKKAKKLTSVDQLGGKLPEEGRIYLALHFPFSLPLLPVFSQFFGDIRFLHVVQDGRVIVLEKSLEVDFFYDAMYHFDGKARSGMLQGEPDSVKAMQLWNAWNTQVHNWGKKHPKNYMAVRIEDFQEDSKVTSLFMLSGFLGIDRQETCGTWPRMAKRFNVSNVNSGRKNVDEDSIEFTRINDEGKDGLSLFGYEPWNSFFGSKREIETEMQQACDGDSRGDSSTRWERSALKDLPVVMIGGSDGSGTRAFVAALHDMGVTVIADDMKQFDVHAKMVFKYEVDGRKGWPGLVDLVLKNTHSADYEWEDLPESARFMLTQQAKKLVQWLKNNAVRENHGNKGGVAFAFKAPVSMLLLPVFQRLFDHLLFVHVVRDGRDVALSSNQSPVTKFYNLTYPDYEQRSLAFKDDLYNVKAIQLWNDWNVQVHNWLTNPKHTMKYLTVRSEDLIDPSSSLALLQRMAQFTNTDIDKTKLCCVLIHANRDFGESKHMFNANDNDQKDKKEHASSLKQRYGKWQAALANNTKLLEHFYREGAEGLRVFGYEPYRHFNYLANNTETISCEGVNFDHCPIPERIHRGSGGLDLSHLSRQQKLQLSDMFQREKMQLFQREKRQFRGQRAIPSF